MSETTAKYHTEAEYAKVLAARLWFRVRKLVYIAEEWGTCEGHVREILKSEAYRTEVETIMRTSRSPENFLKWVESSGDYIPSGLAERMHLPGQDISEMVERVKSTHNLRIEHLSQ